MKGIGLRRMTWSGGGGFLILQNDCDIAHIIHNNERYSMHIIQRRFDDNGLIKYIEEDSNLAHESEY